MVLTIDRRDGHQVVEGAGRIFRLKFYSSVEKCSLHGSLQRKLFHDVIQQSRQ